jgi:hypothetical protein
MLWKSVEQEPKSGHTNEGTDRHDEDKSLFIIFQDHYDVIICKTEKGTNRGPGSSVGIAPGYGLDGPGIESRGGGIFRTCPDRPWGPPILLYNGYRVFPGGRMRLGCDADPSAPSSTEVQKTE